MVGLRTKLNFNWVSGLFSTNIANIELAYQTFLSSSSATVAQDIFFDLTFEIFQEAKFSEIRKNSLPV